MEFNYWQMDSIVESSKILTWEKQLTVQYLNITTNIQAL